MFLTQLSITIYRMYYFHPKLIYISLTNRSTKIVGSKHVINLHFDQPSHERAEWT